MAVTVQRESSAALGQGCRLGFLGTLHMSVLVQRLKDEYGAEVCVTAPTVPYKGASREKLMIRNTLSYTDHRLSHISDLQGWTRRDNLQSGFVS
jgi:translation elongation factor EF-4